MFLTLEEPYDQFNLIYICALFRSCYNGTVGSKQATRIRERI